MPKVGLIHTLVLHEFGDNGLIQRTVPAVGVPPTERFWYHIPVTEHRRENAAASAAALALALAAVCAFPVPAAAEVPESVEWRDQVVYFLMTDRFADGDHTNNDQKAGEFNPADGGLYSGGDLAGVRSKLDYIQGLGATAVWLTPPVANVWYDPVLKMAGYHGYWAADFKKVDAHLGILEDYRGLAADLHRKGMLLIQDIVTNHTGDFFSYSGPRDPWTRPRTSA